MTPDGKVLPTVAEKAKQKGLSVGLLTSDSINGATPSAFCAHVSNRGKVEDIKKIMSYGVMTTPALVIDGQVKVAGKIPSVEEIKQMIGIK
jgi:alkaline phosphatase